MRGQRGFTLLELLVGLVVLGFILAGLSQGVRYGLRASDAQARLMNRTGELDSVDRAWRRLLTAADPGSSRGGPSLVGSGDQVRFVAVLPAAVTGFVDRETDVALVVDAVHRLVLRWTPHVHATRFDPPPPPQEAELLRGVERIELAYWKDGWRGTWSESTLPVMVRLRIVFSPADPRHWPDVVVAPLRGTIG